MLQNLVFQKDSLQTTPMKGRMESKVMLASLGDFSDVLTNGLNVSYLKHNLNPIMTSLCPFAQEVEN